MKNSKWLLVAGLAIMLMTFGCQKQMGFIAPEGDDVDAAATSTLPIQYNPGGSWFTYFYYMPGSGTAGSPVEYAMSIANDDGSNGCNVKVWNDASFIYVQYNTAPNWWLTQVHVDIGTAHDSLRHNGSGNLQPGQFRFPSNKQFSLNPYVQTYTVPCEWQTSWFAGTDPWEQGDPGYDPALGLLICAHSIVCQYVDGQWVNFQTGTGAGSPPPPPPPGKQLKLPSDCIDLHVVGPSTSGYQDVYYTGIPLLGGPFNVENDVHYDAWCADVHLGINPGTYSVCLWSALDSLPDPLVNPFVPQTGWGNVAWLINNRSEWGSLYMWDVQTVIWSLLGEPLPKPMTPDAVVLYNKALGHDSYRPTVSPAMFPVLNLACGTQSFQLLFTEVDP